ncbi:MAG TPA: hypothetical protein ENJ01_05790 [Gammaproteobacteria bacterium]|nr:hypothetical protein [Gammaproteobacteria bacterium]
MHFAILEDMEEIYKKDVLRLTAQMKPASILVLGGECDLFNDYLHASPQSRILCVSHGDYMQGISALYRVDLAFISGVLGRMNKREAEILLAELRDVHAQRVIVVSRESEGAAWQECDFLAMGMYRIGSYVTDDDEINVYTFDLYDYKPTPDWLNSKDWAHPELFDKHWW